MLKQKYNYYISMIIVFIFICGILLLSVNSNSNIVSSNQNSSNGNLNSNDIPDEYNKAFQDAQSANVKDNSKIANNYNIFPNYDYQVSHAGSQPVNSHKGPIFSPYWGWNWNQPYNGVQAVKDSEITNITFAFLNGLNYEGDVNNSDPDNEKVGSKNVSSGFLDQIQEMKKMGVEVTFSFGGAVNDLAFYKTAASGYVMYKKLYDLCTGYGVYSLDFDMETPGKNDVTDDTPLADNLSWALKRLSDDFSKTTHPLKLRFTVTGDLRATFINSLDNQHYGTNWILNNMVLTSGAYSKKWSDEASENSDNVKAELTKENNGKVPTPKEVYHHMGITMNIPRCVESKDPNGSGRSRAIELAKWAKENELGLIATWTINSDHPQNSWEDKDYGNGGENNHWSDHNQPCNKTDYEYTKIFVEQYQNLGWASQKAKAVELNSVDNFKVYSQSRRGIVLTWTPLANTQYYDINDGSDSGRGHKIQVQRNYAGFTYLGLDSTNHQTQDGTYTFTITPYSDPDTAGKPTSITVKINKSNVLQLAADVEYYDANIIYYNNTWKVDNKRLAQDPYVYYNGQIYQDQNKTENGIKSSKNNDCKTPIGTPDIDGTNWKSLGDAKTYLTPQRINDLNKFTFKQYSPSHKDKNTKPDDFLNLPREKWEMILLLILIIVYLYFHLILSFYKKK